LQSLYKRESNFWNISHVAELQERIPVPSCLKTKKGSVVSENVELDPSKLIIKKVKFGQRNNVHVENAKS
jgi:hypothetical protein